MGDLASRVIQHLGAKSEVNKEVSGLTESLSKIFLLIFGALILIYRPFKRVADIAIAGFEGKVMQIDFRYTTLQFENNIILIPNSTLFTNAVKISKLTL